MNNNNEEEEQAAVLVRALCLAVQDNDLPRVRQLVEQDGVSVNSFHDEEQTTPLWVATKYEHPGVVTYLLERGAKTESAVTPYRSALHYAILLARDGDLNIVRALLRSGAEIECIPSDSHGSVLSVLHVACSTGNEGAVQLLLDEGAEVNALGILHVRNDDGTVTNGADVTPHYYASHTGNIQIVRMLIDSGADIEPLAFIIALSGKHWHIAELFIERAGRGILNRMIQGRTLLCILSGRGDLDASRFLLNAGAGVNVPQLSDGSTPLAVASQGGHAEVVKELLRSGALVTTRNRDNKTPLGLAYENGHIGVTFLLLRQIPDDLPSRRRLHVTLLDALAQPVHRDSVQ